MCVSWVLMNSLEHIFCWTGIFWIQILVNQSSSLKAGALFFSFRQDRIIQQLEKCDTNCAWFYHMGRLQQPGRGAWTTWNSWTASGEVKSWWYNVRLDLHMEKQRQKKGQNMLREYRVIEIAHELKWSLDVKQNFFHFLMQMSTPKVRWLQDARESAAARAGQWRWVFALEFLRLDAGICWMFEVGCWTFILPGQI